MNILILIFAILYFLLAKFRLDLALMLLLAGLPSYLIRFSLFGLPMTLLELMIVIAFGVWFIWETNFLNCIKRKYSWKEFLKNKKERKKYPFSWEIMGVLIVSYIAVGVAGFSDSALGIWKAYFFEPLLLFILVLNVFKGEEGRKKILWSLVVSAFFVSVFAI